MLMANFIDEFLLNCENFNTYDTEEAYINDLRKYIMYYWNMTAKDTQNAINEHKEFIHASFLDSFPIADLANEMIEGVPTEEEVKAFFDFEDEEGTETLNEYM